MLASVDSKPGGKFWIQREIEDLYSHVSDHAARDYLDVLPGEAKLDTTMNDAVKRLRNDYCHAVCLPVR